MRAEFDASRERTRRPAVVCQLLHGLRMGGAEVLAGRLARRLRANFRFLFACLDELGDLGESLRAEGYSVTVLGRRPGVDWQCTLRLSEFLRRQRVDLVHAHQYTPFFYAVTSRVLYRRPPVLFTEHGRWHPDYPRRKRILANRLLLERRDRVIGVGGAVRQALIDNEGLPTDRVGVIYNGIHPATFAASPARREIARRTLEVSDNDFVLMQVARLDGLKDHATALHSMDMVRRRRPDARLILVGEGPERGKIEELVRQLDLGAHVRLLGLRNDIAGLLPGADAALLTSISEGIPLTLIEAMAAGLPVVATRVGGNPEVVVDGSTGLLAPAGDHVALADKVLMLAEVPGLRRRLGEAGRHRAVERFSEDQMMNEYRRLYTEMLGGGRSHREDRSVRERHAARCESSGRARPVVEAQA